MKYAVLFDRTDTGYSAHVPDLPGCVAPAETLDETVTLIREAIRFHLDGLIQDGDPVPQPTTIVQYIAA